MGGVNSNIFFTNFSRDAPRKAPRNGEAALKLPAAASPFLFYPAGAEPLHYKSFFCKMPMPTIESTTPVTRNKAIFLTLQSWYSRNWSDWQNST